MKNNKKDEANAPKDLERNKERLICKFQRPLLSTDGDNCILVYDEQCDVMEYLPVSEEDMEFLFPDEALKTYWLCEKEDEGDRGVIYPIEQVEEQGW